MIQPYKEIAEFIIENIMGCKFVGIAEDGEVFVSFEHDDRDLELAAIKKLRKEFIAISKVTVVVVPSIPKLKQMVDDLNKLLDEPAEKPLLDIGEF